MSSRRWAGVGGPRSWEGGYRSFFDSLSLFHQRIDFLLFLLFVSPFSLPPLAITEFYRVSRFDFVLSTDFQVVVTLFSWRFYQLLPFTNFGLVLLFLFFLANGVIEFGRRHRNRIIKNRQTESKFSFLGRKKSFLSLCIESKVLTDFLSTFHFQFYWVLLGFTGFYWVLLGFSMTFLFLWNLVEFLANFSPNVIEYQILIDLIVFIRFTEFFIEFSANSGRF